MTTQAFPAAPEPQGAPDLLPCSASQERFWFLDRLRPGDPALNVAFRWNVRGQFSAQSLEGGFRAVVARHEVLRTRYVEVDGRAWQAVMPTAEFRLPEIDIRATPEGEQAARVDAIAGECARQPFDLTRPGLIRATLIRLGNDRAILAITVHHICFDGWSIGVLGREVGTVAAAIDAGHEAILPPLALQFCDYALWQRAWLDSPAFAEEAEDLRARLQGAPYFELIPDHPRPPERTIACASVQADLPVAWGERLKSEARRRSMSPFAYGAAVLSAMLARCAGTADVTVGTQVAGRSEVDLEPLIGVFINNVVLRFDAPGEATMEHHLHRAAEVVREAVMAQGVPFNKLVERIGAPRDPSRTPLLSINFILQKAFLETTRYGGFELSSVPSQAAGAMYDLTFMMIGRATGWRMTVEYNADLFARPTAESLLALWQDAFRFAFDRPAATLATLPLPASWASRRPAVDPLAGVESALAAHPLVAGAAAVGFRDAEGTERVHAFVTPSERATMPLEALPELLADTLGHALPAGSHPAGVSVLLALPRNGSGRMDKTMLPAPPCPAALDAPAAPGAPGASGALPQPAVGELADAEARLARIWSGLLGVATVSPAANFFDLGGHSLLMVRMLAQVQAEFGRRLSLATIYRVPTLRALARELARGPGAAASPSAPRQGDSDWRVLVLQPEGDGIPLIALNNAQTAFALSERFGQPRPALNVRIFDRSRDVALPPRSFEEIAAQYVNAVRSAQAHGPYALYGNCVHGNLAVEVARQLKAMGEEVALVVLKDVWEPRYADRVRASRLAFALNRLHVLRLRLRFLREGDMSLAAFLGSFRRIRGTGLLDLAVRARLMERVRFTDLDQEGEEVITYLTQARNHHRPAPYDGTVLHFVTSESPQGPAFEPAMGWDRVVTGRLVTLPLDRLSAAPSGRAGLGEAAAAIEKLLLEREGGGP